MRLFFPLLPAWSWLSLFECAEFAKESVFLYPFFSVSIDWIMWKTTTRCRSSPSVIAAGISWLTVLEFPVMDSVKPVRIVLHLGEREHRFVTLALHSLFLDAAKIITPRNLQPHFTN
ncbi:hypothetical protein NPIL_280881 [Nephila pilipes]|uniref:Uncharacterized protein n=1 Tax=Nephila pilipes TaxID=299642 RepID=A0A8X6KG82_NEPPI|nr:hypothetical protein NPIL_280881 [Nephila pilipes]